MSYAVLQTETTPPTEAQLVEAYTHIDHLTTYDARMRAKGVAGVIAVDLSHDEAMQLLGGLASQGIGAAIVAMHDLPFLETPYGTRRIHVTADALVPHDTLDRPEPVAWADVTLLAVGAIRESERTPGARVISNTYGEGPVDIWEHGGGSKDVYPPVLEIHTRSGRPRWVVRLDTVVALDLEGHAIPNGEHKPIRVVRQLASLAGSALLNRGAEQLIDTGTPTPYMTRAQFEYELAWLHWIAGI